MRQGTLQLKGHLGKKRHREGSYVQVMENLESHGIYVSIARPESHGI